MIILSVDATPVNPSPSPKNAEAVIIPLVLTEESLSNVVAVSALPVTSPVKSPVTLPTNVVAVIIPVTLASPSTHKVALAIVVPIPTFLVV